MTPTPNGHVDTPTTFGSRNTQEMADAYADGDVVALVMGMPWQGVRDGDAFKAALAVFDDGSSGEARVTDTPKPKTPNAACEPLGESMEEMKRRRKRLARRRK